MLAKRLLDGMECAILCCRMDSFAIARRAAARSRILFFNPPHSHSRRFMKSFVYGGFRQQCSQIEALYCEIGKKSGDPCEKSDESLIIGKKSDDSQTEENPVIHGKSETFYTDGGSEGQNTLPVIAFDIETTGIRRDEDRIIEFAARDLAGGELSTISALINPGRHIPYLISAITGITNTMVTQPDVPSWKEVAPVIFRFIESRRQGDGPVILVAHNGKAFDVPFLLKEFQSCSIEVPKWWLFLDSMPLARETKKRCGYNWKSLKLSDIHKAYGLQTRERAHRAMADVNMLATVLEMIVSDLHLSPACFLQKAFTAEEIYATSKVFRGQTAEPSLIEGLAKEGKLDAPWEEDRDMDLEIMEEMEINLEDSSNLEYMKEMEDSENNLVENSKVDTSSVDASSLTPMLRQYVEAKRKRPDFLHMLKIGDYYEAFFEDAEIVSRICKVRQVSIDDGEIEVPVTRFAAHKVNLYSRRLLDKGLKIVKVGEAVLTPGMLLDEGMLEGRNNYLISINVSTDSLSWGLAYCDLSTGELYATESEGFPQLLQELHRLEAAEAVLNAEALNLTPSNLFYLTQTSIEFSPVAEDTIFLQYLGGNAADSLRQWPLMDSAIGALLRHVQQTQDLASEELSIRKVSFYDTQDYLCMDQQMRDFLELTKTRRGKEEGSLLWAIDSTKTSLGNRLLCQWLLQPLRIQEHILDRQSAVEVLVNNNTVRAAVVSYLSNVMDIERLAAGLLGNSTRSWDDVDALIESLLIVPKLTGILENLPENLYFVAVIRQEEAVKHLTEELQDLMKDLKAAKKLVSTSLLLLQETSHALAALDVLCSFAEIAATREYCKPKLLMDGQDLSIIDGRHPMLEISEDFNPNSCLLGSQLSDQKKNGRKTISRPDMLVLTGPKGSGKTIYLQQVGLIQVLAQCGSFVPAKEAKIPITDGIYDGSTLDKVTSNSLVLIDEFSGGEPVLRAVIEYLANEVKARAILCVANFHVDIKLSNVARCHLSRDIHSIISGAVDTLEHEGYPEWVYKRAKEILGHPEKVVRVKRVGMQNLRPETVSFTESNGSKKSDDELEDLWKQVSTLLTNSPATLALAKQKGSLVSVSKTSEPAIVTIGSSPMFVRKFRQHEHAAALEAAFESLLNRPVKLQILVEHAQ